MSKTAGPLSGANLGPTGRARTEVLFNGKQDTRRLAGPELAWLSQALAHRAEWPANLWFVGDSVTECYGVTDDYHRWVDLVRQAIQGRYRSGGAGYIPPKHTAGVTWPYTTNPDGKNTFPITAGAEVDQVNYGYGYGQRSSWMNTACARTGTIDCDRFWIVYSGSSATTTFTIDVDAGTPAAQTATITTASTTQLAGRIWDSQRDGGMTLPLGTHTVKITSVGAVGFLDGVMVFYTDATAGIHVWEGGLSGAYAANFDGVVGTAASWADLAYQPATPVQFSTIVCNGTAVITCSTGAFTDLDLGEYFVFAGVDLACTNGVARIVSRQSATQVTLDRVVASSAGRNGCINRAQFTDGAITSGSTTMTSASGAAFNPWDVNMYVQGPTGIPAGAYIRRYNSPTSVELSVAATATQSAQTVRVLGRQKQWCAADASIIEFGNNDITVGYTVAQFKASMRRIASLIAERAAIGFPVGQTQRYTPSVILLGTWAPGWNQNQVGVVSTTSGVAAITSEQFDFDPSDVGKTITTPSNTPIGAATTIASVQDYRNATLSANAVATNAAGVATIVGRLRVDKTWQPFRQALFELAAENTWRMFDLYSLGGFIGTTDPLNLTFDLGHPNNHGAQWLADELDIVLTGQPKNASIPQGIIDAKGDKIVGSSADVAGKIPAGQKGQLLHEAPSAPLGVRYADAMQMQRLVQQCGTVPAGIVTAQTGLNTTAPTITAGALTSNVDDEASTRLSLNTSVISGNQSKLLSAFSLVRRGWMPEFTTLVKTGAAITSVRYWVGFFSGDPSALASPAVSLAAFRYDTSVPDTAGFWAIATKDGTTLNVKATAIAIAAATAYELAIVAKGTFGNAPTGYDFYINDVLAGTLTANLPATGLILGVGATVTTNTTATRALEFSRYTLTSN